MAGPFFFLKCAVLILSLACGGCLSSTSSAQGPKAKLSITALEHVVPEGKRARVRIQRDRTAGDLAVTLSIGGDAVFEADYAVRGADEVDANTVSAIIPAGQAFIELVLEALDDVAAEAAETVILNLEASDAYSIDRSAGRTTLRIPQNDFVVTTVADAGEGSLRQAILNANALQGPDSITFDSTAGPFATPQKIALATDLPALVGEVTIDGYIEGRLWKPSGVTVSGEHQRRVFFLAEGAKVTLKHLTISAGHSEKGGGIVNRGDLVVKGVTFFRNRASSDGGGIAHVGGSLVVINSTFVGNRAGKAGGGLASEAPLTVTNCTFSGNSARVGGGIYSEGPMLLRNTIVANSEGGSADCAAAGPVDAKSVHNLIEANDGCAEPISRADPRLGKLGGYNGPTQTLPLSGGSPAINLGDNASAVDERGEPLRWDQRGRGDPRRVAGITDIGAFERQAFAVLEVDTVVDLELRACTRAANDCPLRGAIELANATEGPDLIRFDSRVFAAVRRLMLDRALPEVRGELTLDARGAGGVTLVGSAGLLPTAPGAQLILRGVRLEELR
ncbi:MAG: right-handed parallel beta-helix repeat-containing protein [Myxococcales bacterium]|nr:right-handed parallel beta-helix repeat-containing protein [Myxococcales bacterium]MDH3843221.1 right-handed parallel beta-helix repeat-containing protein [Myxococcales bacterium]